MKVERYTREGIRFLVIDNSRVDYAFDPTKGWVSVNYDFINEGKRCHVGIRWTLDEQEVAAIPAEDALWAME